MENKYFKKAIKKFSLELSFNLALIKFGIKNGFYVQDENISNSKIISKIKSFDSKLFIRKTEYLSDFIVATHNFNRVYEDKINQFRYETLPKNMNSKLLGEFLSYMDPMDHIGEETDIFQIHISYENVKIQLQAEFVDPTGLDFHDRLLRKIEKFQTFADKVGVNIRFKLEKIIRPTEIIQNVQDKNLEFMKKYADEIENLISNMSLDRSGEEIKKYLREEENYEDTMISIIEIFINAYEQMSNHCPFTREQLTKSDKISKLIDIKLLNYIKNRNLIKIKELLIMYFTSILNVVFYI